MKFEIENGNEADQYFDTFIVNWSDINKAFDFFQSSEVFTLNSSVSIFI